MIVQAVQRKKLGGRRSFSKKTA